MNHSEKMAMKRARRSTEVVGFVPLSSKRIGQALTNATMAIMAIALDQKRKITGSEAQDEAFEVVRRSLPSPMGNKFSAAKRQMARGSKSDNPTYRKAFS